MVTVVNTTPHVSVVRDAVCGSCGSTLQYVPNDLHTEVHKDYGGGSDVEHFINCPVCMKKVFVNPHSFRRYG